MLVRSTVQFLLAATISCGYSLATAADAELAPATNIRAVWDLSMQPCNGGGGNAMRRSPLQESIRQSRVVKLPQLQLQFSVPQLPDISDTHVKIYLGDRARGVTDNYVLLAAQDLSPPIAAVVVTELPVTFDTTDKVFDAVATLERQLTAGIGAMPVLERLEGPHGMALEMQVDGRVGTHCFPTARIQLSPAQESVSTVGISRFIFTNGKLVEFSLIVSIPPSMKAAERKAYAKRLMDGFWLGLKVI